MESHGSTVPAGFSASVLFQRMSSSVRPVPAMIRAVDTIQQAGEMENNHNVTTFVGENFILRKVSLRNYVYRRGHSYYNQRFGASSRLQFRLVSLC